VTTPNPRRWPPDPEHDPLPRPTRRTDCPSVLGCLAQACRAGWPAIDCSACEVTGSSLPDLDEIATRQVEPMTPMPKTITKR